MTDPIIIENLTKNFGRKRAVDNVSFTVSPGEIIGFLGPNGAGKTSTLRMALGLMVPDSGRALVFGHKPGPHMFGRIGFLPEERGLYRKSTARGAIAHMARLNGIKGRAAFRLADEKMEALGLGEARRKKVKALSKGMAQKVQLIAATAHDPELLILDEPFSGLDPVNQKLLEDMIRAEADAGKTIIFSTHVMEHAERLCSRIILMSRGRKVFDGSVAEALAKVGNKITLEISDPAAQSWLSSFASAITQDAGGVYHLTLKDKVSTQDILKACLSKKVDITRFEPERPSLHDAFVAMVGADEAQDLLQSQEMKEAS